MQFYRKHDQSAEFLQAAGLYYELSTRMENEARGIMGNVIELRKKLESVKKARQKAEQEKMILQKKSELDALTGMANRYRLNDFSDEIFAQALQDETPLAVEILDVDYFKEFNDNYGHQMGDSCICKIADQLKRIAKYEGVSVYRYGGDEFVVIYEGLSQKGVEEIACDLQQGIQFQHIPHAYSKTSDVVTISQGICWDYPKEGEMLADYLQMADANLYRVKECGRGGIRIGRKK